MSAAPTPPPAAPAGPREVRIYGHTALFYWWPVWALGFLFGFLTYLNDSRLVIAPAGTSVTADAIQVPAGTALPSQARVKDLGDGRKEVLERVHPNQSLGVFFAFVLFLVILITNVPLRGVSSAVAIAVILLVIVSISALRWWDNIFAFFGGLSLHMNLGFYVFFSTLLCIAWCAVFFGYDRMSYWRITPGQVTHEFVFGGGETAFDTDGMMFQKLRDDLFRHVILGLGSGDLVMNPLQRGGAGKDELSIHNVLFIGSKIRHIQELISKDQR